VDPAGIRENAEKVERLGIEVARRYLGRADVVLLCLPAHLPWGDEEILFLDALPQGTRLLVLRTMMDRAGAPAEPGAGIPSGLALGEVVGVSVEDGRGLAALRGILPELVFSGLVRLGGEAPILTRRRQREGVRRALDEVAAFVRALDEAIPAEVASTHLKAAETALEELLGAIAGDEILDRVFADFCIGK
jgi:tRNA modification GTPase